MNWNLEPQTNKYGSRMIPVTKQIIVFLLGWIGIQVFATLISFVCIGIASAQDITYNELMKKDFMSILINSIVYVGLLISMIAVINVDIITQLKSFKKIISLAAGVACFIAIIAFSAIYGMLVDLLPIKVSNNANQAAIESTQKVYPFASLIVFGFVAPICEELTYRTGLFSLIKRKNVYLAYAVSVVIFALIHANFTVNNFVNELLNLPHYLFAGFAFAYTYDHYGFAGSVTAHMINNIVGCIPAFFK